jgi:hypothetical protein
MCILYAYKLSLKVSSKFIHPNYYFYCFECVHRVCPNLSSAPCTVELTVNSKEENCSGFCLDFVQEFSLRKDLTEEEEKDQRLYSIIHGYTIGKPAR